MPTTTFTLKTAPTVPLEAEILAPDRVLGLSRDQVRALPVFLGKREMRVDDFFEVEGDGAEELEFHGDMARVKWIGRGMTRGRILVVGNIGMHLGAFMRGGEIEVQGNAGDWIGGEMSGGTIHIHGHAGGQLGAAYRGAITGMTGGMILVDGNAGMEIGMRMKRGLIAVRGRVRDFAGLQMKGGSIFLLGGAELRTGAWMVRGTIVSLAPLPLLPTFNYSCDYNPVFLSLYARRLAALGFAIPTSALAGGYRAYAGDSSVPGKGELLIWQPAAA